MKNLIEIECDNCHEKFKSSRSWARFCSDECRNNYHNKKNPIGPKCVYCGNDNPKLQERLNSTILCIVCAKEFNIDGTQKTDNVVGD